MNINRNDMKSSVPGSDGVLIAACTSIEEETAQLHLISADAAAMLMRFVESHVPENHIAAIVLAATCTSTEEETAQLHPISETAIVAFGFVESHVPESLRLRVLVVL